MYFVSRTAMDSVSPISKTDVTQSWGRVSEAASRRCEPSLVSALCHLKESVPKYSPLLISDDIQQYVMSELMKSNKIMCDDTICT